MIDLLAGVRVLDFTHVHAGPLCTYQLALMGAEIIKIESPGGGDQMRQGHPDGLTPAFLGQNANKRSLCLDIKDERGLKVVDALVATTDIVIHNMRPGTPDRLGIGYERLSELKPDLIYCAISGYGQTGPIADRAAFDHLIQGESGMFMATGTPEQPVRVGFAVADAGTAMVSASAINAALLRRDRTGQGAFLDVSMLESCMALMGLNYYNFLATGRVPQRVGPNPLAQSGSAGTFETKDGTLLVNGNSPRLFHRLAQAVDRDDLLADARFSTPAAAQTNRRELRAIFAEHFKSDTAANWEAKITAGGVPCGILKGPAEVVANPQLTHRGTLTSIDDVPGIEEGSLRYLGAGFLVDSEPAVPDTPPPRLGEHSIELLTELGVDEPAINELIAAGTLHVPGEAASLDQ